MYFLIGYYKLCFYIRHATISLLYWRPVVIAFMHVESTLRFTLFVAQFTKENFAIIVMNVPDVHIQGIFS